MWKLPGTYVLDFDFEKLETKWKLELRDYIQSATIMLHLPKAIKRIVSWLVATKRYKIEWTTIVLLSHNSKTTMTDEAQTPEVEATEEVAAPAEEVAEETTEEATEEVAEEVAPETTTASEDA